VSIPISKRSRLNFTDLLADGEFEYWDMAVMPVLSEQTDDIRYQVLDGDRVDLLADKFYGSPTLWWVLAVANDMEILPTDMSTGDIIRVPSPRYVTQELFKGLK
jgi:hypothetical protein